MNETLYREEIYKELNRSDVFRNCGNKISAPGHCQEVFDYSLYFMLHGEVCWPETPAGNIANHSCPKIAHLGFDSNRYAFRECWPNSTWFRRENRTWSNYTQCVNQEEFEFFTFINKLHVIGYSISLFALVLSLWIFLTFRALRCTRIRIHTQLFTSFIFNNLMWIIWYERVIPDPEVTKTNPVWCQMLHIVKEYFMVANYMWMLCEGLHLHLALVVVFVREERTMRWFYAIGWGVPVLIVMVHSLVRMYVTEDTFMCWIEEVSFSSWFLSVPVVVILFLCTIFLINVLRVILTIMHPNSANPAPVGMKRAARAALILIPLFGLQFILLPMIPEQHHPLYHFYIWLCLIIVPFQGLCCACLFCFANQDVHSAVRGLWHRRFRRADSSRTGGPGAVVWGGGRWSGYRYAAAVAAEDRVGAGGGNHHGVYVLNGSASAHSHRKSTDMTKL
nr:unnamed protein product [Callosobruchus chinensis]